MARNHLVPNPAQVSILMAVAMLAYILMRYIDDPPQVINFQLPDFLFSISISYQTIIAILVAGMMASGMYWLIHNHPNVERGQTWHHVWLPALTTWATSTLLALVPAEEFTWWVVLILGGIVLAGVLAAEFISVDKEDVYYPAASFILTILAFCMYSAIILTWHNASYRLFIIFPASFVACGLLAMRILSLRIPDTGNLSYAAALAIVAAHIAASLHYLPLTSLQYTLINIGCAYSLISLVINLRKQLKPPRMIAEPMASMTIFLLSAWLIH